MGKLVLGPWLTVFDTDRELRKCVKWRSFTLFDPCTTKKLTGILTEWPSQTTTVLIALHRRSEDMRRRLLCVWEKTAMRKAQMSKKPNHTVTRRSKPTSISHHPSAFICLVFRWGNSASRLWARCPKPTNQLSSEPNSVRPDTNMHVLLVRLFGITRHGFYGLVRFGLLRRSVIWSGSVSHVHTFCVALSDSIGLVWFDCEPNRTRISLSYLIG